MTEISLVCRNPTPFALDGSFDEKGCRAMMERFAQADIGVYLGTAGSGESHTMTRDELARLYAIGVEVCKGRVPVYANPPEQHTARETLEHSRIAAEAGAEIVNVYGPAGKHGFKPTDAELLDFFETVLGKFDHPVALNPNPIIGYLPKPQIVAEICRRYPQVVAINFAGEGDGYFVALRDLVGERIALYVGLSGSANLLALGATGLISVEAMIAPKTTRAYLDHYLAGRTAEMAKVHAQCIRLGQYTRKWGPSNARWLKMAMRVLKLPGGTGTVRPPYLMPPEPELQAFAKDLVALGIPEIEEQARTAGLLN